MNDETIITSSKVGQLLESIGDKETHSYLVMNNKKVAIVSKITIGRSTDNDIVIDNKLASRHHAFIQKIKDDFYLKDLESTNGTFLNGKKIPQDKYVKISYEDRITIGNETIVLNCFSKK